MDKKMKRVIVPVVTSLVIFLCLMGALEYIPDDQSDNNLIYNTSSSCNQTPIPSTGNMINAQSESIGDNSTPQPESSPTSTPKKTSTLTTTPDFFHVKYLFIGAGTSRFPSSGDNENTNSIPTTEITSPSSVPTNTATSSQEKNTGDEVITETAGRGDGTKEVPEFPTMIIPVLIIVAAVFLKSRK